MREIDRMTAEAVENKKPMGYGNTCVAVNGNNIDVYLFGNNIYSKHGNETWFTLSGWDTNVTRNRLRALDVKLTRENGTTYYNGMAVEKNTWYKL